MITIIFADKLKVEGWQECEYLDNAYLCRNDQVLRFPQIMNDCMNNIDFIGACEYVEEIQREQYHQAELTMQMPTVKSILEAQNLSWDMIMSMRVEKTYENKVLNILDKYNK